LKGERNVVDHRALWESRWADRDYDGGWRLDEMPVELQQAVAEGWFPPRASLLDIGCGDGEVAAWLAGQGYDVLGIDFASAAIAKARTAYGGVPALAFDVVDISQAPPGRNGFGALFDRGCLHSIPQDLAPEYVRNVAAVAEPDARFLLLHRVGARPGLAREDVVARIETLCRDSFDVVRVADAEMGRRPGVACWMIRVER